MDPPTNTHINMVTTTVVELIAADEALRRAMVTGSQIEWAEASRVLHTGNEPSIGVESKLPRVTVAEVFGVD